MPPDGALYCAGVQLVDAVRAPGGPRPPSRGHHQPSAAAEAIGRCTTHAGLPGDPHPNQAVLALLVEHNVAHHQTQNVLALRCRGRTPDTWQILSERGHLGTLRLTHWTGLLALPGVIGLLDGLKTTQLLLPNPFQGARHKPVLWFHG